MTRPAAWALPARTCTRCFRLCSLDAFPRPSRSAWCRDCYRRDNKECAQRRRKGTLGKRWRRAAICLHHNDGLDEVRELLLAYARSIHGQVRPSCDKETGRE